MSHGGNGIFDYFNPSSVLSPCIFPSILYLFPCSLNLFMPINSSLILQRLWIIYSIHSTYKHPYLSDKGRKRGTRKKPTQIQGECANSTQTIELKIEPGWLDLCGSSTTCCIPLLPWSMDFDWVAIVGVMRNKTKHVERRLAWTWLDGKEEGEELTEDTLICDWGALEFKGVNC